MPNEQSVVLEQIDALLREFDRLKDLPRQAGSNEQKQAGMIRLRAAISRLAPPGSPYALEAARIDGHPANAMPYLAGRSKH